MITRITTATPHGILARPVTVEVDVSAGDPRLLIQGLPPSAGRQTRALIVSALGSCGVELPGRSILVSLHPPARDSDAGPLTLPIALALLAAVGEVPAESLEGRLAVGELGLDGAVRPVRAGLAVARLARRQGCRELLVPAATAAEAAALGTLPVVALQTLRQAIAHLRGEEPLPPAPVPPHPALETPSPAPDLAEVRGQEAAKRALEIAAAGGHHLLLIGPPGAGKTLLARRLPGILPPLSREEAQEVTRIYSLCAGVPAAGLITARPFRAPHPATSTAGLLGGGRGLHPGEVSLAHHGVLFLDEVAQFQRASLEALRGVLDRGEVELLRSGVRITYPARFSLVAAMAPCLCGHAGDRSYECRCSPARVARYRGRVSGGLLDRFDLHVEVPAVTLGELRSAAGQRSAEIARRVAAARQVQHERLGTSTRLNSAMSPEEIRCFSGLDTAGRRLLDTAFDRLGLSARARDRILGLARTIADLAAAGNVHAAHLAEAIQYRALDRRLS